MPAPPNSYFLFPTFWIDGRQPGKPRRDLDHRLVDQHRDRVQVAGVALEPEPLRLERQRAAARERVVEGGQFARIKQRHLPNEFFFPYFLFPISYFLILLGAGAPPACPDLVARRLQHLLVGGVLPQHEILDDAEEPLALLLLLLHRREEVRITRRVVHHLREDHRPRRRQRPPRPPQVQRARVAVADGLLAGTGLVDRLQRQGDFDEFLLRGHAVSVRK